MKQKLVVLGLLVGALIFTGACGAIGSLLGGRSAGTVTELWADVPRMDGMTKADLEMPLAARLAMQAITQGRMNFIAFTSEATPQAVLDYYTTDRMAEQGWNTQDGMGCFGDSQSQEGTVCIFSKTGDGKNEILGIVAAIDAETNKTAIFFGRIDATEQATEEAAN